MLRWSALCTTAIGVFIAAPGAHAAADAQVFRGCPGNLGILAEAEQHPVNGDVLVELTLGGCDEHPLQNMGAVVAGRPAELVATADMRGRRDTIPYALSPAPEVGDTVELVVNGQTAMTLTVAGPDEEPPSAPEFSVAAGYDYSHLLGDGETDPWSFVVDVNVTAASTDASALRYEIELSADGTLVDAFAVLDRNDDYPESVTAYDPGEGNPFHQAEEICVSVRAIDAANNTSDIVTDCIAGVEPELEPSGQDNGLGDAGDGAGDGDDGGEGGDASTVGTDAPQDDDGASDVGQCQVGGPPGSGLLWLLPLLGIGVFRRSVVNP